jgi:hypothetical protein
VNPVTAPARVTRKAGSSDAALRALATQTQTDFDVVRDLYDQEIADLQSTASIKSFIPVIASRRVKQRLKTSRARR